MLASLSLSPAGPQAVSTAAAALAPEGGEESDAAAELMLSPDDAARAQRELRITKLQVPCQAGGMFGVSESGVVIGWHCW